MLGNISRIPALSATLRRMSTLLLSQIGLPRVTSRGSNGVSGLLNIYVG